MTAWEVNPAIIKTLKNVAVWLAFCTIEFIMLILGIIC